MYAHGQGEGVFKQKADRYGQGRGGEGKNLAECVDILYGHHNAKSKIVPHRAVLILFLFPFTKIKSKTSITSISIFFAFYNKISGYINKLKQFLLIFTIVELPVQEGVFIFPNGDKYGE